MQPKLSPPYCCHETTGDPCSHVTVPALKSTETGEVSTAAPNIIIKEKNSCAETMPSTLRTNPICSSVSVFGPEVPARSLGTAEGYAAYI